MVPTAVISFVSDMRLMEHCVRTPFVLLYSATRRCYPGNLGSDQFRGDFSLILRSQLNRGTFTLGSEYRGEYIMPNDQQRVTTVVEWDPPAYVKLTAVFALISVIISFVVPVVGVLFVTPLAIVLGSVALFGGDFKSLGMVTVILIVVNLAISPSFWLNVGAGSTQPDAVVNRFLTYFDVIGVIVMFVLFARRKQSRAAKSP